MCIIKIDDYLKNAAEIKRGKTAMSAYVFKESIILGRCPVCIAERILRFTRELNGPYTRGKRLLCLKIIRDMEHTCGGEDEQKD